jgi:opacity protein-like surface antigen
MKNAVLPAAITLLLIASQSHATYTPELEQRTEPAGDYYISALGGLTDFSKTTLSSGSIFGQASSTGTISYDIGFHGTLAYGYHFDPASLRVEGQFTYTRDQLSKVTLGATTYSSAGTLQVFSLLLNSTYEFINVGVNTHPYIGVGAGAHHLRFSPQNISTASNKNLTRFGYQLAVGILIHKKEGFAIDLGYRRVTIPGISGFTSNLNLQHISVGINFDIDDEL